MFDLALDWLSRQGPETWLAIVYAAVVWAWGTLRLGSRSWQLTRFLGGAALAWWRKPTRTDRIEALTLRTAERMDKLCGVWGVEAQTDPAAEGYDGGEVKLSAADLCEGQQEMAPVVPHPATGEPVHGRTGKPLRGGLCGRGK